MKRYACKTLWTTGIRRRSIWNNSRDWHESKQSVTVRYDCRLAKVPQAVSSLTKRNGEVSDTSRWKLAASCMRMRSDMGIGEMHHESHEVVGLKRPHEPKRDYVATPYMNRQVGP